MTLPLPHRRRVATVLFAVTIIVCCSEVARADGGRLVHSERVQDWIVSIFVAPNPPHVGLIDVSVLVQEATSGNVISNADIAVTLRAVNADDMTASAPASRNYATNKLLQSALLLAPIAGEWHGTIFCRVENKNAEISFPLHIAAAPLELNKRVLWILWPIAIVLVYVAHRLIGSHRSMKSNVLERSIEY